MNDTPNYYKYLKAYETYLFTMGSAEYDNLKEHEKRRLDTKIIRELRKSAFYRQNPDMLAITLETRRATAMLDRLAGAGFIIDLEGYINRQLARQTAVNEGYFR